MTFVKTLSREEKNGRKVIATENWDKFSDLPRYEVSVFNDETELFTIRTARTTWRRKFKEMVSEYIR